MKQHLAFVDHLVAQGGPRPAEYPVFDRWLAELAEAYDQGDVTEQELVLLRGRFGKALSVQTLQGFSLVKPHGYAGDFEIIDRIYTKWISDDPALKNWDRYFHALSAPRAVRNRKSYCKQLLQGLAAGHTGTTPAPVLDVASGPARDLAEFFAANGGTAPLEIDCIDLDGKAIAHARTLCWPYLNRIMFQRANALRYTSDRRYRLIWSAGLFDYFNDKGFKFMLTRLLSLLDDEGEVVIGNFAPHAQTQHFTELIGEWFLHYREPGELVELARACGMAEENVRVGSEAEGVNLFLHVRRGPSFIPMHDFVEEPVALVAA